MAISIKLFDSNPRQFSLDDQVVFEVSLASSSQQDVTATMTFTCTHPDYTFGATGSKTMTATKTVSGTAMASVPYTLRGPDVSGLVQIDLAVTPNVAPATDSVTVTLSSTASGFMATVKTFLGMKP